MNWLELPPTLNIAAPIDAFVVAVSPLYLEYFITPLFEDIFPLWICNPAEPPTYIGVEWVFTKLILSIVIPLDEETKNTPLPQASPYT